MDELARISTKFQNLSQFFLMLIRFRLLSTFLPRCKILSPEGQIQFVEDLANLQSIFKHLNLLLSSKN